MALFNVLTMVSSLLVRSNTILLLSYSCQIVNTWMFSERYGVFANRAGASALPFTESLIEI